MTRGHSHTATCTLTYSLTHPLTPTLTTQLIQVIQVFDSWAGNLSPMDYDIFAGDEHTVRVHLPITSVYLLPIVTLTCYDIFAGNEHTAISLHYILYPYTLSFYLPIVTLTCYDIFPGDEHTAIHHFRYFAYHIYLCPPLLLSRLLFHIPCSFYSSLPL